MNTLKQVKEYILKDLERTTGVKQVWNNELNHIAMKLKAKNIDLNQAIEMFLKETTRTY